MYDLFSGKTGTYEERIGFIYQFLCNSVGNPNGPLTEENIEAFLKNFGSGRPNGSDTWDDDGELAMPEFIEYITSDRLRSKFVGDLKL